MQISQEEEKFLAKYFPELKLRDNIISGTLKFAVLFSKKNKVYNLLKWDTFGEKSCYFIRDSYEIDIDLSPEKNIYREVKNTDGRILKLSKQQNIPSSDLHVYDRSLYKNKVCLYGYLDENYDISFWKFLCEIVVPFFYDQSFHEKHGTWPRGEYSHGCLGILENYYDICKKVETPDKEIAKKCINLMKEIANDSLDKNTWNNIKRYLSKKKIKNHWKCLGKARNMRKVDKKCNYLRFQDCHPEALLGVKILHKQIKKHSLKYLIT